jgi:hypothetical protein
LDLFSKPYLGLEWIYEVPRETPTELEPQAPLDLSTVPSLPTQEAEKLYAFAVRGNHKKVLEQLAQIEKLGEQFKPLVTELRAFARNFDTDAVVDILEEMGVKP